MSAADPAWHRSVPLSTYRVQLTPGFGFAEVAAIGPYLARLGITHVYLSPALQAAPGSTHGYDVVDHSRASDDLGGEDAFRRMISALHRDGIGVVLDIVPNHMASALPQNRWWWDVLENGPSSFWASFFDIDWDPPDSNLRNRVLLPVLGRRYGQALASGELAVSYDGRSFTVHYFDHVFPLAPRSLDRLLGEAATSTGSPELEFIASSLGQLPPAWVTDRDSVGRRHRDKGVLLDRVSSLFETDGGIREAIERAVAAVNADAGTLDDLLERQNYRLAFWRTADQQLDYRRFFDIDSLVALRVEDAEVFAETHAHVLRWVTEGLVDGLRVDHIDGLAEPQHYLERLRDETDGAWVVVEKILHPREQFPGTWPAAGTTGYDFLNLVGKLWIDGAGEQPLTDALRELTGTADSPEAVVRAGKELILDTSLAADLHRVVERVLRLTERTPELRDVTRSEVHTALRALVTAFGVYRTYGDSSPARPEDIAIIEDAARDAKAIAPDADPDLLAFLVSLFTGRGSPDKASTDNASTDNASIDSARLDTARRFEQLTGPVMAKGVEDTAFYRYHRLVCINEVGGELTGFATTPHEWHSTCLEAAGSRGASLLATTTHDTKRSEDVRARLALLSEMPDVWLDAVRRWLPLAERHRTGEYPDRATEYLLFQTVVGAWPISTDRALDYARKATREAKVHTSWTDPNPAFDDALETWVRGLLADEELRAEVEAFVGRLTGPGRVVSLAQTLCKLTAPGIPDIYQGMELWGLSLVDPDNRRPVDYNLRADLLTEIEAGTFIPDPEDEGTPKMLVTARALQLRRRRPSSFGPRAAYVPLEAVGPASQHVIAYGRGPAGPPATEPAAPAPDIITIVPRLVVGLASRPDGWGGTALDLPPGRWRDVLTGVEHEGGDSLDVGVALSRFPVSLLEQVSR